MTRPDEQIDYDEVSRELSREVNGIDSGYISANDIDEPTNAPVNVESSESDSVNQEIHKFEPEINDHPQQEELQRTPSMLQKIQSRLPFFHPKLKSERAELVKKFITIYILMIACILGIFSIYWGSAYQRMSRLPNLKMLVVIDDTSSIDDSPFDPIIGNTIEQILNTPAAKTIGGWDIKNITDFQQEADKFNNTIEQEITRQIHHQLYWTSIYVTKNATGQYYDYIMNDQSTVNISNLIVSIYETGRDFINMNSYITPAVSEIEAIWLRQQSNLTQLFTNATFNMQQIKKLSTPIEFEKIDNRPYTDAVLIAPSQVGLIYIIILTFFQVNLFGEIHQQVAKLNLKPLHYVLYRLFGSYFSYFIISLGYSLVTLAFQVDFNKAFGKSGFLVYWMFSYITMISVGLINEVMFMVLLIVFPPLVGFWLLFWVLVNISATFAPVALVPNFFRFGYAMPIHNSYELTKVVFFDTYKGQMGRNIGIIFAWIVIGTIAFVAILKPFGQTMMKRAIKAKQQEAEKQAAAQKAKESQGEA